MATGGKSASERDIHISNLIREYNFTLVTNDDVPRESVEQYVPPTTLSVDGETRRVVHTEHYFCFWLNGVGRVAPATSIKKLRHGDAELTEYEDILDEAQPWSHHVTLRHIPSSDETEWNAEIHVERWCENGTWEQREYMAYVDFAE